MTQATKDFFSDNFDYQKEATRLTAQTIIIPYLTNRELFDQDPESVFPISGVDPMYKQRLTG